MALRSVDVLLEKWHSLIWIQKTLKFINGDATSVHGCVRASSIFTGESGEWKLAGFEVLSSLKEDDPVIYVCLNTTVRNSA
jgi:SCY1-like protein 1